MSEITTLLKLQQQAQQLHHRLPLVICGDHDWCLQQAEQLLAQQSGPSLWLGESQSNSATVAGIETAKQHLGREWAHVVYDAWCGLDPDALAAIAGTIKAGGLFILLCPDLAIWPDFNDPQYERIAVYPYQPSSLTGHYLRYFAQQIQNSDDICIWQQSTGLRAFQFKTADKTAFTIDVTTPDQQQSITAIQHVVSGHPQRPAVLISDRGRGKSAAMGMAAAAVLLKQDTESILVTAPRPAAVATLFQHASAQLPGADYQGLKILWQGKQIEFVATDALIRHPRRCNLLLVDEAAAIPTPMLRGLLQHYPRIAFATTVHGYEGTGRAFTLRFEKELAQQAESYQVIQLKQAIRWAAGDPLEHFLFQSLMLDAELPALPTHQGETNFQRIDKDTLINKPDKLRELYALLHTAHYRTRPYDLRQLLDGPNIEIYTLTCNDQLLGTVMLARESISDPSLHQAIIEGRRRPRGHLIPQSLATHGGWREALNYSYGRIIRIAVHPEAQDQGLGSYMLKQLQQQIEGLNFLAASFGATTRLLNFWQHNGFQAVRLGFHRETNSGLHALMMLKPLNGPGEQHCHHWQARLQQQLPLLMADVFSQLEDELLQQLIQEPGEAIREEDDQRDVADFIHGYRQYEACILGLQRLLQQHPDLSHLPAETAALIQDRLLRRQSWAELAQQHRFKGRREAEQQLRKAIEAWQNTLQ